jgi:eukaryotic-like serine/threonine-protein kinase
MKNSISCEQCSFQISFKPDESPPIVCPMCGSPIARIQNQASEEETLVGTGEGNQETLIQSQEPTLIDVHEQNTIITAGNQNSVNPIEEDDGYIPFSDSDISVLPSEIKTPPSEEPTLFVENNEPTIMDPEKTLVEDSIPVTKPCLQKQVPTPPTKAQVNDPSGGSDPTILNPSPSPSPNNNDPQEGDPTVPSPADFTPQSAQASQQASQAPPSQSAPPSTDKHQSDWLIGKNLGGYLIKKKIGAGGMGSVYLAYQTSLDREVALKVLPPVFATNPSFVARFTREALAVAQLNHHNVIQVIDVGVYNETHYISMEFVRGSDLGNMTKSEGRLTVEDAVGYVLQAARGLLYSHTRGIIHRDIKPDNIMVNEHGVVKVADLGLAKIQGHQDEERIGLAYGGAEELKKQARGDLTGQSAAMGTPSYMAPEQGQDAGNVDHRADQYSLGCTLYYLLSGSAPFTGKTSFEIINKHISEPVKPVETVVKNVPKELSLVIEKMLAKEPVNRYPSLNEVIDRLETYLGIEDKSGAYTPREHHLEQLEDAAKKYYSATFGKIQKLAVIGFFLLMMMGFFISAFALDVGRVFFSAAFLGTIFITPVLNFLIGGFLTKNYLFRRVKNSIFGMRFKTWILTLVISLFVIAALHIFGLLIPWAVITVMMFVGVLLYQIVIAGKFRQQRAPFLKSTMEMLKTLRIRGVSEEALQDFICRYAGTRWEDFFEQLFGYEEMIVQRSHWAKRERNLPRKKHAIWRDPLVRWLDDIDLARKKAKEEILLAKAEKDRLKSEGMDDAAASQEASRLATEAVSDGFLPSTQLLEPGLIAKTDSGSSSAIRSFFSMGRMVKWGLGLVRLGFAVILAGIAAYPYLSANYPGFISTYLDAYFEMMQFGKNPLPTYLLQGGLPLISFVMFFSVFSSRIFFPTLMILGTFILLFMGPVMNAAGRDIALNQLNILLGLGVVGLCTLGSFTLMVILKLGGGKY